MNKLNPPYRVRKCCGTCGMWEIQDPQKKVIRKYDTWREAWVKARAWADIAAVKRN